MDDLYHHKVTIRDSIKISSSIHLLELSFLKDWRIYLLPIGAAYKVYGFGHKNTQKIEIDHLKKLVSKSNVHNRRKTNPSVTN
jgi:hypothetical protein